MAAEMWTDDIGRCFCAAHKRMTCHECCFDFAEMNMMTEIDKGLRKPFSRAQELAKEKVIIDRALAHMRGQEGSDNYQWHMDSLKKVKKEMELLDAGEVNEALAKAMQEMTTQDIELRAVADAWAKSNPGQTTMEYGGPETQALYDAVASAPNSRQGVDVHVCAYCNKSSAEKLQLCARCKQVAFCSKECQKASWPAHKKVCVAVEGYEPRKKLALTWEQLEAYGGGPATGKMIELRAVLDESMMRQVLQCKDRVGQVRRIAAYTNSRSIPNLRVGGVMRWTNPRFHYFMDGSSGARIEEEDLPHIQAG